MNRIMEELACNCVLAPQEVAASTLTASQFVDMAGLEEVSFLIATGSLGRFQRQYIGKSGRSHFHRSRRSDRWIGSSQL